MTTTTHRARRRAAAFAAVGLVASTLAASTANAAETDDLNGTFTPVAAPGPCIVLTAPGPVTFGDVQIGGDFVSGFVLPGLEGCADPSVRQRINASSTSATAAGGAEIALVNETLCPDFTSCAPLGSTMAIAAGGTVLRGAQTPIGLFNSTPEESQAGDFPFTNVQFDLKLSPEIPVGSLGETFSFTVTFLATSLS
jgi:hypothetical protein